MERKRIYKVIRPLGELVALEVVLPKNVSDNKQAKNRILFGLRKMGAIFWPIVMIFSFFAFWRLVIQNRLPSLEVSLYMLMMVILFFILFNYVLGGKSKGWKNIVWVLIKAVVVTSIFFVGLEGILRLGEYGAKQVKINKQKIKQEQERAEIETIKEQRLEEIRKNSELGSKAYDGKQYEEAIRFYEKVLALDSSNEHAWYVKGSALYMLSRYVEAIESYDKISDNLEALFYKCDSLMLLGRHSDALNCFRLAWGALNSQDKDKYRDRFRSVIDNLEKGLDKQERTKKIQRQQELKLQKERQTELEKRRVDELRRQEIEVKIKERQKELKEEGKPHVYKTSQPLVLKVDVSEGSCCKSTTSTIDVSDDFMIRGINVRLNLDIERYWGARDVLKCNLLRLGRIVDLGGNCCMSGCNFSEFDGESSKGEWKIWVRAESGWINSWQLIITPAVAEDGTVLKP